METVKFTATKLINSGKQGILRPDEHGYYILPIGGLNCFNSAGEYYTLDGAKQLFEKSSVFMRRVSNGCLKGELGHPKRQQGQSMDDYVNRILTIDENNVVCHYGDIWLDHDFGKNNPKYNNPALVAIMGKVKPSGPKGRFLKESLDNPKEDVCFSVRALTKDYYHRGVNHRVLQQIVTLDNVVEPGIDHARKYDSPALESMSECLVTKKNIKSVIDHTENSLAVEDSRIIAIESLKIFDNTVIKVPTYSKW